MTVEQQLQAILDAATAALDAANTALAAKGATPVNSISELAAQIDSISGGGADVSGVTAKASDVREDVVFYGVNGKETGTIRVYGKPGQQIGTNNVRVSQGKDLFGYDVIWFETTQRSTVIYPEGIKPYMTAKIEKFGDATAADVRQGKTFTSAAGYLAKGTASF